MSLRPRRVTLEDVAREAGVSSMTVSRVINNTGRISAPTRARVMAVIERLGYRPSRAARALVTRRTAMLGVIVPDITNPYFSVIMQGIEDIANAADYSVLMVNTNETPAREEAALQQLDDSTIDGLILCSSRLPPDTLEGLLAHHPHVVSVNRKLPPHLASSVRTRHDVGYRAYMAARFLASHGHERIGYVHLTRSYVAMFVPDFIAKLAEDGITVHEEWTRSCLPSWEAGYAAGADLLSAQPDLTAVIGGNDLVALGIMRAATERGLRIPQDLAIIGGDDILLARLVSPALTTYHVPCYHVGVSAAELLFKRLEGDTTYREIVYDEDLIVRGSAP